ncbi:hypothetical protein LEP1GSC058_3983 [Leptospira fainei serovar Hurstbridge str. BUT 6]|uniref:Uncharacterized protein n=1 Tax=Leptospira fainei serovar Hurstbridge str. BUT 6 TaxID=1193011 RepID=S3UZE9_9LEPT|nr:hypothetical protein LEP1GSC058_3983 [Leptospira fainei serovar Hurstbridge str. BUT 6]
MRDCICGKRRALSKSMLRSREGKLKFPLEKLFRDENQRFSMDRYNACHSKK